MSKRKILLQVDPDLHPSAFDSVVAIDAGVDQLLTFGSVRPEHIETLVHGAIFTRGPQDLHATAIFIGGSDVVAGEQLLDRVRKVFFGPMRVSVMLDANGANTTAAAAVRSAARHLDLATARALVLAGTGPVGQRAARLLARQGAHVRVASRRLDKAADVCQRIGEQLDDASLLQPVEATTAVQTDAALEGVQLVIAAGAAGVQLLSAAQVARSTSLCVAIDLNAVPPAGIEGVSVTAAGETIGSCVVYGAIGVGGTKMKLHKAALRQLFSTNSLVLDAEEIYALEIG